MSTRLHITEHGTMFTVRITSTAMGQEVSATISGPILYALVDGLLWWCINRKLDALVACAQRQPAPAHRDAAIAFGHSLQQGEEMVMQCFTTPFHEHTEERQQRIMHYLQRYLPDLHPIASHGPHSTMATAELAQLTELATVLKHRIAHPYEAMHGIEGMVQVEQAA